MKYFQGYKRLKGTWSRLWKGVGNLYETILEWREHECFSVRAESVWTYLYDCGGNLDVGVCGWIKLGPGHLRAKRETASGS